ncbi:MAG: hypothetical protein JWO32_2757 [Bacteroidetes bacterium]|nr:hypothetical protein [Bacteroidota bacterium]
MTAENKKPRYIFIKVLNFKHSKNTYQMKNKKRTNRVITISIADKVVHIIRAAFASLSPLYLSGDVRIFFRACNPVHIPRISAITKRNRKRNEKSAKGNNTKAINDSTRAAFAFG